MSEVNNLCLNVVLAGASCSLGQTSGHPADLLKLKMQLPGGAAKYQSVKYGFRMLMLEKGTVSVSGLFTALRMSLAREFVYSGIRVGLYTPARDSAALLLNKYSSSNGGELTAKANLPTKVLSGLLSGGIATVATNPLELLKIRYMAASAEQRAIMPRGVFQALIRLHAENGLFGMWRGFGPNITRASFVTAVQLASYDEIKQQLLSSGWFAEGQLLHFTTSLAASLISVCSTNPVDVVKTRMMMPNSPHKTMYHTALNVVKTDGILAFYRGAFLAWLRLGPHTIVSFVAFEKMRELAGIKPI